MSDSRQLEREAEQTRSHLERTLDELRERITPGQLVDQAVDIARESGGGDLVRNLGRQVAENPLSLCLIGAGLAWLALGNGRGTPKAGGRIRDMADGARESAGAAWESARERTSDAVEDAGARMRSWASDAQEGARGVTSTGGNGLDETWRATSEQLQEGTRAAADQIRDAASSAGDAARKSYEAAKARGSAAADALSGAASATASSAAEFGQSAVDASSSFVRQCADQPLVLAGLGLAIGAAIGAALPPTEAENRLIGDTSDQLKDQVTGFAQAQYEKGKDLAKGAVRDAMADAGERMPSADAAGGETASGDDQMARDGAGREHGS